MTPLQLLRLARRVRAQGGRIAVPFSQPRTFLAGLGLIGGIFSGLPAAAQTAALPSYYGTYPPVAVPGQWSSSRVFYSGGRLSYVTDAGRNRIPDYSYAGYGYGERDLPIVAEVVRVTPISGDNTARIQQAIDQVGARTPDSRGIRGAVVLAPGNFEIRGTVRVNKSGVVLRGAGDDADPASNTILRATGDTPHQRPVVSMGTGSSNWTESSTRANITTSFVPVNALSFEVASTAGFAVGDAIVIHHPSTQAWINAVDGGGMVSDPDWTAGSMDIVFYRVIRRISGTTVTIDAPIYNHLDRALSQSYVAKVTSNHITQAGIENLRIDIITAGGEDENHAWNGVDVNGAHDSWVVGVTALHFGSAGVVLENAVRCTVDSCRALDPVAIRTGSRMYNFNNERRSQLNLFSNCEATFARHSYISNGVSVSSGIVYTRCSQRGGGSEGGHRMWTQGILYDNITELSSGQVLLINRGDFGSSHGWGTAHSTIWKYNSEMLAQKPPTAQNYAISNAGTFRSSVYYPGAFGVQERQTGELVPASLYEAQLCDRLALKNYALVARHSGKVLLVSGASTADGAAIVQGVFGGAATNDEFHMVGIGAGFSRIVADHSGKALAVQGASSSEGAVVVQMTYTANAPADDEWRLERVAGGFYRIVNRLSGRVLGIAGGSTADGAAAQVQTWTGATHQQFSFAEGSVPAPIQQTSAPVFSPSGGTFTTPQAVAMTTATSGATIRYTSNGTDPTPTTGTVYTGPVTVSTTTTLRAIATAPGLTASAVTAATYTIAGGTAQKFILPGSAVSNSSNDGNVAANTVDGDLATRWSANGDGQWIQYDLGAARTVAHLRIAFYNGSSRTTRFDIQVASAPTGPFTTIRSATSGGTTTALETFDVTDTSTRFVRILGHGNSVNAWNSLTEVEIWGF